MGILERHRAPEGYNIKSAPGLVSSSLGLRCTSVTIPSSISGIRPSASAIVDTHTLPDCVRGESEEPRSWYRVSSIVYVHTGKSCQLTDDVLLPWSSRNPLFPHNQPDGTHLVSFNMTSERQPEGITCL